MTSVQAYLGEEKYLALLDRAVTLSPCGKFRQTLLQKTLRIAFLGGSVTYGYHPDRPDTDGCFADLIGQDLNRLRGENTVICRNFGISGTGPVIGGLIAEHYLTDFAPHIICVEYAINETFDRAGLRRTEGLICKLLHLPQHPVVIPISLVNQQGYSCEAFFEQLAAQYQLPLIALRRSLYTAVESGELPWEVYSDDGGHPHSAGHRLIADAFFRLYIRTLEEGSLPLQAVPLQANGFSQMRLVPPDRIQTEGFSLINYPLYHFPSAWQAQCGGSAKLTAELFCSTIVLVFVQENRPDFAAVSVEIDGTQKEILQGQSIFGWHNPVAAIVLQDDTPALHKITIRRLSEDNAKTFYLQEIAADYQ